jgi:hypothetical protein
VGNNGSQLSLYEDHRRIYVLNSGSRDNDAIRDVRQEQHEEGKRDTGPVSLS